VPSNYTKFSRVAERVDYIDIVMVANLQRVAGSSHPLNDLDWTTINAFANIGLDPESESSEMTALEEDIVAAKESIV